ncbi:MAG: hypothetical protein ACNYNX_11400 [Leucobacter sp.]
MRTAVAAAGGPGPEELGEWIGRGFALAQAREWIADGVPLEEAEAWRAIGIPEAGSALRWRVRGMTPGEARLLAGAGRGRRATRPRGR